MKKKPTQKLTKKQMGSLFARFIKKQTTISQRNQQSQAQSQGDVNGSGQVRSNDEPAGSIWDVV